jgi:hypothetical protein
MSSGFSAETSLRLCTARFRCSGGEVGIAFDHASGLMTQERLNGSEAFPCHGEIACIAMSKVMKPKVLNSCTFTGSDKRHG